MAGPTDKGQEMDLEHWPDPMPARWPRPPAPPRPAVSHPGDAPYVEALRPSEYTAALLRVLEQRCGGRPMRRVLDIGFGNGILLAALARLGAADLWGVDIDSGATQAARDLLRMEAGEGQAVHLLTGDLWAPVPPGLTFDVVVANLPHFPGRVTTPGRGPYWAGGDGRATIDRFLAGLPRHLAPGGSAFIAHHDLIGPDRTAATADRLGLWTGEAARWTVFEPRERMAAVAPDIISAGNATLRYLGRYAFVDARVLEFRIATARCAA